jgi:hypothetical protein
MIKMLVATAVTVGMVSAAAAADLPRTAPVYAPTVGKAPIGKGPIGKAPMGKHPQPVYTKG